jgi:hypothetical protein
LNINPCHQCSCENISIKLGTPIWFPSSWLFETFNISLFGAINLQKTTPQKYLGLTFEQKNRPSSQSFAFHDSNGLDFTWVAMLVTMVSNYAK